VPFFKLLDSLIFMECKLTQLRNRAILLQDIVPNKVRKLCLLGLSKNQILNHIEIQSICKANKLQSHSVEEIYNQFIWIWGFKSKYNIDFFIHKFQNIPSEQWCCWQIADKVGRKNVLGHLGLDAGKSPNNVEEVREFLNLTNQKTTSIKHINDGVFYPELGSTPKDRIINFLNKLKQELKIAAVLNQDFPEQDASWSSLRSGFSN
jgi:hypothetical protein